MPFLYAALPITLAVVGTLAITLVLVEVVVPALLDERDARNNRRRRQSQRDRRQLIGVGVGGSGEEPEARSSATRGDEGTNELLRRRRKHGSRTTSMGRSELIGQTREDDDRRYILGDVTASEHEHGFELADRYPKQSGDRPPAYQAAVDDSSASRSSDALLLFEAGDEDAPQDPFVTIRHAQNPLGSYEAEALISLADPSETFHPSAAAAAATAAIRSATASSSEANLNDVDLPFATPPLLVDSLAASPVLVPLPLASAPLTAATTDDGWIDATTTSSSLVSSPVLVSTLPSSSSIATPSFVTAPSSSAPVSSNASAASIITRTVSQASSSVSMMAKSEATEKDDDEEASWTRLSDEEEELEEENVWAEIERAVPSHDRTVSVKAATS